MEDLRPYRQYDDFSYDRQGFPHNYDDRSGYWENLIEEELQKANGGIKTNSPCAKMKAM